MRKIVTILLIAALSLSCFSAFACGGGETEIYSITYSVADGTLPDGAISEYSESDKDISLPTPTKAGYTFAGWKNGSDVITVIAAGTKGDLYLTATWQANSYTITFDYGEGTGTETSRDVEYGSSVTDLPIATPPSEDKSFLGWKKQDNSLFNNGDQYLFDSDITLTAVFFTRFTVTLNNTTAAGFTAWADDSTGSKAVLVDVGDKLIIPAIKWDGFSETQKEAENYEFLGWFYRDKDNAERQFDPNAVFTLENLNLNTYSVTIYAKVRTLWAGPF